MACAKCMSCPICGRRASFRIRGDRGENYGLVCDGNDCGPTILARYGHPDVELEPLGTLGTP